MSGVDEQLSEFRCPECGSTDFERTAYGYRTIRINIESGVVLKGDWGNEDTDGWECSGCGYYPPRSSPLCIRLYEIE